MTAAFAEQLEAAGMVREDIEDMERRRFNARLAREHPDEFDAAARRVAERLRGMSDDERAELRAAASNTVECPDEEAAE